MTAYARGASRERQLMERLDALGWVVYRFAGSHGNADLIALKAMHVPMLIQVKGSAAGPWSDFGPDDRYALMVEARKAGCRAWLAWWPPRKPVTWYSAPNWEEARPWA